MAETFKVTGLGLQVDGAMIMPGSDLILSRPAPSHWSRFGDAGLKGKLTVATPAATSDAQKPKAKPKKRQD